MAGARLERTRWPGIYRRGDRYAYEWTDGHGRRRRSTVRTIEEARSEKARREEEARRGGAVAEQGRVTFAEYAREWVGRYHGHGRRGFRDNTRDDYRRDLEKYAIAYFGLKVRLAEITPRHVADFIGWLCEQPGRSGPKLSDSSVRRALCPLRACMASAVREGLITHNPTHGAALPHRPRLEDDDHEDVRALTSQHLEVFLAVVHPEYRTFFAFLAATGLRISEAAALEWRHLTLDGARPVVKVRRALVRGRLGLPKSRHGRRDVPLPPELVRMLRAHRASSEWPRAEDLVFASRAGTAIRAENVRRRYLKPAAEEAGAPWAGFHTFRHTCASRLFAAGRNAVQVQKWLGHHSAAFTLSTYVHLLDDDLGEPLELPQGSGGGRVSLAELRRSRPNTEIAESAR
jgi:integrase